MHQTRYYMMTPAMTPGVDVDVLCIQLEGQLLCLADYQRENRDVALVAISAAEACKLLEAYDGVGMGCYLKTDNRNINSDRAVKAGLNLLLLAYEMMSIELPESKGLSAEDCSDRSIVYIK